jgi:hypothetical protein
MTRSPTMIERDAPDEIHHRGFRWQRGVNRWEMNDHGDLWAIEPESEPGGESWRVSMIAWRPDRRIFVQHFLRSVEAAMDFVAGHGRQAPLGDGAGGR